MLSISIHPTSPHPHAQYIRRRKVFFAHDENEECVEGDVVMIKSCFPISKMKHFTIEEILDKAPRYEPPSPQDLTTSPASQVTA